ncbi:MAG: hypothetical protein LV480_14065 [Methylacidiphilales bacterium]|nr:hypothetical protein [Candidatus Methylacidiphilales bacterium]
MNIAAGKVDSFQLIVGKMGFYLGMNANTKLQRVRDLAKSKIMELQPLAGEEMNLPQSDPHRDGFVDGERTLAAQILALIDEKVETAEPGEEDMILSLGRT